MPDEIDRDQEFNEQRLEEMIEQNRFKPGPTPSLFCCRVCGKPIPEKRRQTRSSIQYVDYGVRSLLLMRGYDG